MRTCLNCYICGCRKREESSHSYVHPYIHNKLLQLQNELFLEGNVCGLEGRNSTAYKFDGKDFPVNGIP